MPKFNEKGDWEPGTERDAYRAGRKWLIIGVIALIILPAIIWGLSVAFSDTAGRGNAIKTKNDSVNRINKQEMFESLFASVKSYVKALTALLTGAGYSIDTDQGGVDYEGMVD